MANYIPLGHAYSMAMPHKFYKADSKLLRQLGEKIRELRLKKGYTLEELADQSGLNTVSLSRIENGHKNFTICTLYDIAKGLETTPSKIIILKE